MHGVFVALPIIFTPKFLETAIIGTSIGAGMTFLVFSMHQLGRVNIFSSSYDRSQRDTRRIKTRENSTMKFCMTESSQQNDNESGLGLLELTG